jgi:hypothetical protein
MPAGRADQCARLAVGTTKGRGGGAEIFRPSRLTARGLFLFSAGTLRVLGSGQKRINRKAGRTAEVNPDQPGLAGVGAGGWASILRPDFIAGLGRSRALESS